MRWTGCEIYDAMATIYNIVGTRSLTEKLQVKIMTESADTLSLYLPFVTALELQCFVFNT